MDVSPSLTLFPKRGNASVFGEDGGSCRPPVDTKYGLPTACRGERFDEDLDGVAGYEHLNPVDLAFLKKLLPSLDDAAEPKTRGPTSDVSDGLWRGRRRSVGLEKRWFGSRIWKAVRKLAEIEGSIKHEFKWELTSDEMVAMIQDEKAKQVTSPWGDSILLKSFSPKEPEGSEKPESSEQQEDSKKPGEGDSQLLERYLNIFCVGCGVKGRARISDRAVWNLDDGISEAKVEVHSDMEFILKIGIDAKIALVKKFSTDLLDVGLPGLTYGPVVVGPSVSLGATVELEAAARGRLLAGAEMGFHNAHIGLDLKALDPLQSGWTPYFKPMLEANGDIMVAARLGLSVALKVGFKVFSFEKSAKLVNEPSVRGVAQAAASFGLDVAGGFSAGFDSVDGCGGILSQLTWRNRMWANAFGLKTLDIHDTGDRELTRACIPYVPCPCFPCRGTAAPEAPG